MSYCSHYKLGGAWPCTIDAEGDVMADRMLKAISLTEAALRAHEQGASADQLSEYLEAIRDALLQGGEDVEADEEPESGDPEASPGVPPQ